VLLARALVGRPDVLLLDEALDGLDAASRRAFLGALRRCDARMACVLSTHRPADRLPGFAQGARLDAGRLHVDPGPHRPAIRRDRPRGPSAPACVPAGVEPLLALRRVRVYRGQRRVLGPLDWTLSDGEHWHVAGPNGAGKSTFIGLLYGDFAPAAGGCVVRRLCPPGTSIDVWKQCVGIVSPELHSAYAVTGCTAEEIVISGLHASIGLGQRPTAAERRRAIRWLRRLGLGDHARCSARELSHGQLRRALIARALVRPRRLLLLDEPLDGLDGGARVVVAAELKNAVRHGAQLVIATHHAADVPGYVARRLTLGSRGAIRSG